MQEFSTELTLLFVLFIDDGMELVLNVAVARVGAGTNAVEFALAVDVNFVADAAAAAEDAAPEKDIPPLLLIPVEEGLVLMLVLFRGDIPPLLTTRLELLPRPPNPLLPLVLLLLVPLPLVKPLNANPADLLDDGFFDNPAPPAPPLLPLLTEGANMFAPKLVVVVGAKNVELIVADVVFKGELLTAPPPPLLEPPKLKPPPLPPPDCDDDVLFDLEPTAAEAAEAVLVVAPPKPPPKPVNGRDGCCSDDDDDDDRFPPDDDDDVGCAPPAPDGSEDEKEELNIVV
mmetsp:Transcript_49/g.107  ORF Transcript_49/g.107 Transcript_49/m.107 type:complete len:286 (-) Transcript_49:79-936(-)